MPEIKVIEVRINMSILAESDNSIGLYDKPTNNALSKRMDYFFDEEDIVDDVK